MGLFANFEIVTHSHANNIWKYSYAHTNDVCMLKFSLLFLVKCLRQVHCMTVKVLFYKFLKIVIILKRQPRLFQYGSPNAPDFNHSVCSISLCVRHGLVRNPNEM